VVLYQRWEQASRSRLAGAGFKLPSAAAFKRRGGERLRKRRPRGRQVRVEEMSESKPFDEASLMRARFCGEAQGAIPWAYSPSVKFANFGRTTVKGKATIRALLCHGVIWAVGDS